MEKTTKNIFENAYFGKAYKTRDGRKALFHYKETTLAHLYTENDEIDVYISDGCVDYRFFDPKNDIVSEWEDKETLDALALEYFNKQWSTSYLSLNDITDELDRQAVDDFKAGYHYAKEK